MIKSLIRRRPAGIHRDRADRLALLFPGLLVSVVVALAATFLSEHYGGPAMLFALLLGIAFNVLSADGPCKPGIDVASRTVLRFGVALLGARITVSDALSLGAAPILLALVGVVSTIGVGLVLSRLLGFSRSFGLLTGAAVGICGASAALAISSVLPKREGLEDSDVIFTVVVVTTFSTLAMVLYPILLSQGTLGDTQIGMVLGATIHDVAQVVGAGFSISEEAGDAATLTKLLRVAMLVPVVLALSVFVSRGRGGGRAALPGFLVGFVLLVGLNSLGLGPPRLGSALSDLSRWILVTAIAALGMKTMLGQIVTVGPRALLLILAETIWIAGVGVVLVVLLQG